METHCPGANGTRLFTPEFEREQIGRLARGEATIAEVSRELHASDWLLQRRPHLLGEAEDGEVVPQSDLRAAE